MDNIPTLLRGLIQVAGIHDLEEANMLIQEGVHLIGIPLRLTVNAEDLSEAEAAAVSRTLPGKCCLITYLDEPAEIAALVNFLKVSWVQLHGPVDPAIFPELRRRIPEVAIIKSLVIGKGSGESLIEEMKSCEPWVSAFITDTYNPSTGAEGATGLVHDWAVSRTICSLTSRPLILAGGLRPDNVEGAIHSVRPWGVDVHTGVEDSSGGKSREAVRLFVANAKSAFRQV